MMNFMVSGEDGKRFEKCRLRAEPGTSWIWNRFVYYPCTSAIFDRPNRFGYFSSKQYTHKIK